MTTATPSINNGIFMGDRTIKATSNLDSYHLMNMIGEQDPTDLGPIDLWAMAQKVEMPLYQLSNFNGKNTILVDHPKGEYKWQIPIVNDLPYIMENVESGSELGLDGIPFRIKLNKRAFGHSDIITYDKMSGSQYRVTEDDIIPSLDGYIFTIAPIVNDSSSFIDTTYLEPGQVWERIGSAKSNEYGEKYSDLGEVENGYREFYNFVGESDANVSYSITSKAALIAKGGMTKGDNAIPITEIWRSFDHGMDPSITSIDDMVKKMGKEYITKAKKEGKLSTSFITKMEAAHLTKIGSDIERYIMWGHGGIVSHDGPDDIRLSVGLWKQLDNSFKTIYNLTTFNLDLFRGELFNHFRGKVDFKTVDPSRTVIVQTGMAGMKLVNAAIMADATSNGLAGGTSSPGRISLDKSGINAISGNAMDLNYGFTFTSFTIPFLANVKFVLNPSFDNVNTNNTENPLVNGYNLSSYSFIIFDITDDVNDNIYLLKKKYDNELKWHYQNGTMDYMGRSKGFASTGNFSGYRVFMSQAMPAIKVQDPTRILKLVLRNPVTGGSL